MEKIYKFKRVTPENPLGEWEDVEEYLWQWEAEYEDGTILKQFDDTHPLPELGDGFYLFRQIADIDQSRLKYFRFKSPRLNKEHVLVFNRERWRLICIYIHANLVVRAWKTIKKASVTEKLLGKKDEEIVTHVERKKFTASAYGYENKVGGIVVKNIIVIMPNGEVIVTDDINVIKLDAVPEIIYGVPDSVKE